MKTTLTVTPNKILNGTEVRYDARVTFGTMVLSSKTDMTAEMLGEYSNENMAKHAGLKVKYTRVGGR